MVGRGSWKPPTPCRPPRVPPIGATPPPSRAGRSRQASDF